MEPSVQPSDDAVRKMEEIKRGQSTTGASGDWKHYHDEMVYKMTLERLRDAMRRRDYVTLERAINECKVQQVPADNEELMRAKEILKVIHMRAELKQAVDEKNAHSVYVAIDSIEKSLMKKYLQNEVREARHAVENFSRLHHLNRTILDMDKNTMSEIRRYHFPPVVVSKVMQAALLLLGVDEGITSNWRECQKLINPHGARGLNSKIMEFSINQVDPKIAARARQILEGIAGYDLDRVKSVSLGAGTFWVWTMGVVEEVESTAGTAGRLVTPASLDMQREIFGTLPLANQGNRKTRRSLRPGHVTHRQGMYREPSPDKYHTNAGQPGHSV